MIRENDNKLQSTDTETEIRLNFEPEKNSEKFQLCSWDSYSRNEHLFQNFGLVLKVAMLGDCKSLPPES